MPADRGRAAGSNRSLTWTAVRLVDDAEDDPLGGGRVDVVDLHAMAGSEDDPGDAGGHRRGPHDPDGDGRRSRSAHRIARQTTLTCSNG